MTGSFFLLRHGLTLSNLKKRYCGWTDEPLCKNGILALETKRQAVKENPSVIFTSGLLRTTQTAKILWQKIPQIPIPDFREMNFGKFEGKTYAELKNDSDFQNWISDDFESNVCPNGESFVLMQTRVLNAFKNLGFKANTSCLCVHGGTIFCLMRFLFPQEKKNRYEWQGECGSGYKIRFSYEHGIFTGLDYESFLGEKNAF